MKFKMPASTVIWQVTGKITPRLLAEALQYRQKLNTI
jgi:hypothetical protein